MEWFVIIANGVRICVLALYARNSVPWRSVLPGSVGRGER